jgi:hypothetical protein
MCITIPSELSAFLFLIVRMHWDHGMVKLWKVLRVSDRI